MRRHIRPGIHDQRCRPATTPDSDSTPRLVTRRTGSPPSTGILNRPGAAAIGCRLTTTHRPSGDHDAPPRHVDRYRLSPRTWPPSADIRCSRSLPSRLSTIATERPSGDTAGGASTEPSLPFQISVDCSVLEAPHAIAGAERRQIEQRRSRGTAARLNRPWAADAASRRLRRRPDRPQDRHRPQAAARDSPRSRPAVVRRRRRHGCVFLDAEADTARRLFDRHRPPTATVRIRPDRARRTAPCAHRSA